MNVLIIDDNSDQVKGIEDYAKEQGWTVEIDNFQKALTEIDNIDPDVVVLDLREDEKNNDMQGKSIFNTIWKYKFRPVIIFSGFAETFDIEDPEIKEFAQEPLFTKFAKGGDEKPVCDQLEYLADVVPSLSQIRRNLNMALIRSADGISTIKRAACGVTPEVQSYLFSNRIMQFFIEPVVTSAFPAWSQYIYPSIGDQLFMGDIVRKGTKIPGHDQTRNYAVILTPSCDIARGTRNNRVVIAYSGRFDEIVSNFHETYNLDTCKGRDKETSRRDKIKTIMNTGYSNSKLYLPRLIDVLPDLCFDFKDIDFINIETIQIKDVEHPEDDKWYRVASLSSPYRERVAWAYMNTACRPGVPTIDVEKWMDDIFDARN